MLQLLGTAKHLDNIAGLMMCNNRAEIIKIEHPTRGDDTRAWGPPYAKHVRGNRVDGPGESAYFLSVRQISTSPCLWLIYRS